jgi:tetratricopeptide (TPR) repeat protein
VAWTAASVAVAALGVKVAPLVARRTDRATVVVPAEAPTIPPGRVLVNDFADHVGDPALASALSDAFRTGLTESPSLTILSARRQRVGAVVNGSIDSAGRGYSITLKLVRPDSARPLPVLLETATDSADVVRALARLSAQLREQLGEPTTSVAATPRLDAVTSPSLAALRSYADGARAIATGDRATGLRSLRTAVTIDSGFAAAYRLMATTYTETGDGARAAEALDHAIANQTRLPFNTRYHTVASHALSVTANYAAAIDAYNRLLERHPDDVRALDGLGVAHAARREYAVQESLLVRAIASDADAPALHTRLALALVNQGKYDDARRVLDRAEGRFSGMRGNGVAAIAIAAAMQDWESAEREARVRVGETPTDTTDALDGVETLADIRMTRGQLAEAERDLKRIVASGTTRGGASRALSAAVRLAYLELRYRRSRTAAVATMSSALRRYPLARMPERERPYDEVARLFADAGQPARAHELLAEASRTRFGRSRGADANRHWTLGAIAMAEGHAWEGEIELHSAATTHPCPVCALPQLARAYEVAGKPDSAIATYERYLHTPWQRRFETDAIELGFAMERLGALYQQQRDNVKAAELYAKLIQLWRGADSELDPLLTDVRRRLEQTGGTAARR